MALSSNALALTGPDFNNRWNAASPLGTPVTLTYSFLTAVAGYDTQIRSGFRSYSDAHKTHVRDALAVWDAASGISFVEVDSGGDIAFSMVDMSSRLNAIGITLSGFAYFPSDPGANDIGGDVFLNAARYADDPDSIAPGVRGFSILLHEIGHALGLKHPFEDDPILDPALDNGVYTVMSYDRPHDTTSLGVLDLEVTRFLYGFDASTPQFDQLYNTLTGMTRTTGTQGDDTVQGSDASDFIVGLGGEDRLFGFDGNDVFLDASGSYINGGDGRDTAITLYGRNTYEEQENTLVSSTTGLIDDYYRGGFGDDSVLGGAGNDLLLGDADTFFLSGRDTLDGGTGADLLQGGGNADFFVFEQGDSTQGPDVIGRFDPALIYAQMSSAAPNTAPLIASAQRDFEIGVDRVQITGFTTAQSNALYQTIDSYVNDTPQGAQFDGFGVSILFIGIFEAELLAEGGGDVFSFF